MRILGLTGPTGAGKGEFGRVAREKFGALHIDTDRVAREVVEPGMPCLDELTQAFGTDILHPDGSLDRKALAALVFSDKEKLQKLNQITHPAITAEVRHRIEAAKAADVPLVIIDAPLLFESGENVLCDVTVGVIADEEVRLQRILSRDHLDPVGAERRMASAKQAEYFKERCDHILENNADTESFAQKICAFLEQLGMQSKKE